MHKDRDNKITINRSSTKRSSSEDSIVLQGISDIAVRNAELTGLTPGKLAVNLLVALFTPEELAKGNCTKATRDDIVLLNQEKIQGIRGMQMYGSTF